MIGRMEGAAHSDGIDARILEILRVDGRATLADIGHEVGLSAPAVKRRIDKLEQLGVITGFTVLVDETKLGHPLEAFTELRFAGNTSVADIAGVARDMPEVQAVFTTAGDPDALVHIRVRDIAHLTQAVDRLRRSDAVVGTKTLMVLDTWIRGERRLPGR